MKNYFVLIILLMFLFQEDLLAQYTCGQAAIGGGGFVSGVVSHKTSGDVYCRTDVGGAYRWDAINNKWVQLLDWISDNQAGYSGVESIALDPQNANNIYLLCGISYLNSGATAILKSTDKGNTFTIIDVTSKFKTHGNGSGRGNGERLVVDPNNSNILFCGTRANGLWKSTDGGSTWNLAWSGVTTTTNGNGICFVVFDPSSSVVGGATQTMYIGISQTGSANIYKSTNGGATFTAISANIGYFPHRAALSGTTMYVTHADAEGPGTNGTGKAYKLNTSTGVWTDISPFIGGNYSYSGVGIDPSNINRVVVSTTGIYWNNQYGTTWGDLIYLSTDGGSTWTLKNAGNSTYNNNGIGWASGQLHWAGSIEFTPGNTAEVRAISGNGVFTCSNIDATNPSWKYDVKGIEETALLDGISIPGGPLLSIFGDITGFLHSSLTAYPAQTYQPTSGSNWSIAYAAASTSKVVRIDNGGSYVYYSTDQGSTWTACSTNKGWGGKVALSADGGTILHCPGGSSTTYYTTNNGGSWSNVSGVTITDAIPVADQVNSNYFYIHNLSGGQMLVSSDKGVSFSAAGTPGSTSTPWVQTTIRTVSGYEGHVWVPLVDNGLKYSTDHGATYTTVSNVTYCAAVGIGKTAVSATYPTIFIWGTVGGIRGLFRSTDKGATWTRVNDDAHQFGGTTMVFGDLNVFGRVYMSGASARGMIYWDESVALPIELISFTAEKASHHVLLKWSTTSEVNFSYFSVEKSEDGMDFSEIGRVYSKGSSGPGSYEFADFNFLDASYYRLKMIDKDGSSNYSNIVFLLNVPRKYCHVSKNRDGELQINVTIQQSGSIKVLVYSVLGQKYAEGEIGLSKGTNLIVKDFNLGDNNMLIRIITQDGEVLFSGFPSVSR